MLVGLLVGISAAASATGGEEEKPILMGGNYDWINNYADEIDYTVYLGIGINSSTPVYNRGGFINFQLQNAESLSQKYGGAPSWNVTASKISGEDLDFSYEGKRNGIWGDFRSLPTTPS